MRARMPGANLMRLARASGCLSASLIARRSWRLGDEEPLSSALRPFLPPLPRAGLCANTVARLAARRMCSP
eukprot:6189063-Pleurochrysis_carterae.AAC.4